MVIQHFTTKTFLMILNVSNIIFHLEKNSLKISQRPYQLSTITGHMPLKTLQTLQLSKQQSNH